jgi:hypothetical protein
MGKIRGSQSGWNHNMAASKSWNHKVARNIELVPTKDTGEI